MFDKYIFESETGYIMYKPRSKRFQNFLLERGEIQKIDKDKYRKRITNWLFRPEKVQRFYKKDGTFEDRLIGELELFYGLKKDGFSDVIQSFIMTEKMIQPRYINQLYPGMVTEAPRTAIHQLRAYLWGLAIRYSQVTIFKECTDAEIKKSLDIFRPDKDFKPKKRAKKLSTPKDIKLLDKIDFSNPDLYEK